MTKKGEASEPPKNFQTKSRPPSNQIAKETASRSSLERTHSQARLQNQMGETGQQLQGKAVAQCQRSQDQSSSSLSKGSHLEGHAHYLSGVNGGCETGIVPPQNICVPNIFHTELRPCSVRLQMLAIHAMWKVPAEGPGTSC